MMIRLAVVLIALLPMSADANGQPDPKTTIWQVFEDFKVAQAFDCSRKTCPQISSCEEACYKLVQCGDTARDADNDGIPCENNGCFQRCEN